MKTQARQPLQIPNLQEHSAEELKILSLRIRERILQLAHRSKSAHVGSALSAVDVLSTLYFSILRLEDWEQRDIFILSKAHAAMVLYSTLVERGILAPELLSGYHQDRGTLPAHLDKEVAEGIEASTGSLGHGFNLALGQALGFKRQGIDRQVFTLIGDGESQEGSVWEGALFAPKLNLDNFTAILDINRLQGYGRPDEICAYEPQKDKWEAFGWEVFTVDGHSVEELKAAFKTPRTGRPRILLARTVKGKGISFMEDQLIWHYYRVTDEHLELGLKELQTEAEELKSSIRAFEENEH